MIDTFPQFFTATISGWKHLLKPDKYKDIIVESLQFLVNNNRIILYGFVIMPNHIHLIWQMRENNKQDEVQRDFLKFTSQKIKFDLIANHPLVLEKFRVDKKDRKYQLWKHKPLSVPLWSREVFEQKLEYIHQNPVHEKWKLVEFAEQYKYSSASYYITNSSEWNFITHYMR